MTICRHPEFNMNIGCDLCPDRKNCGIKCGNTPTENQPSEPNKVKPLAQYLGEYLATGIDRTHEAGMPVDFTKEGLKPILEQALDAYQSTENVKIRIEPV